MGRQTFSLLLSKLITTCNYVLFKAIIILIRCYQWFISPVIGNNCRFHPSCSDYACQALEIHGWLKGSFLAVKRILRCHPWHPGGHDPVPNIGKTKV